MKKNIFICLLIFALYSLYGCEHKVSVVPNNQMMECTLPPEPDYGKDFFVEDLYIGNKTNVTKLGFYVNSEKAYKERLQNIIKQCYESQLKKNNIKEK